MEQNGTSDELSNRKDWRKFPFKMVHVDKTTEIRVLRYFKGPMAGLLHTGPEKWVLSKSYAEYADDIYNFEARLDDVYVSSFVRSGTTWTQDMIWLLCNDLNYEASKATKLDWRFPFLEMPAMILTKNLDDAFLEKVKELLPPPSIETLNEMTTQRFIKTHLPMKLMPYSSLEKGCKIVYVARNPKDVIVSFYHFAHNQAYMYDGTFEQFVDCFMDNMSPWCPYIEHIKDGWSRRNEKNVLFLFYEDLVMDLKGSLKKLATFLERPLSDSDLPGLMDHLDIDNFKHNTAVNKDNIRNRSPIKWDFVRRGQIGGNVEMTPEISDKIDEWYEKQMFGCDLKFPYQLRHKMEMYKLKVSSEFKK